MNVSTKPSIAKFGVVVGESPLYAAATVTLARYVMQFITSGFGYGDKIEISAFRNCLAAELSEGLGGSGLVLDSKTYKRMEAGRSFDDFGRIVWECMVKTQLSWAETLNLGKSIPLLSIFVEEDQAEATVREAGGQTIATMANVDATLAGAWKVAKVNIERWEARICLAFMLKDAARGRHDKLSCRVAEEQVDALIDKLYDHRTQAKLQLFAIGTLMGDAERAELKTIVKEMYSDGKNVMHLMHLDAHVPGEYPSSSDTRLRAAIKSA